MQVKNLRAYAIYLPYAGLRPNRGWKLGPGELSLDLPTDRFYSPLLQRDWQHKWIELVFNRLDVATLGPAVVNLLGNATVPAVPAENPGPVSSAQVAAPEVPMLSVEPEEPPAAEAPQETVPVARLEPQIVVPVETSPPADGCTCPICGKARKELRVYPPMTVPICKYCFRDRGKTPLPLTPDPVVPAPPSGHVAASPHAVTSLQVDAPAAEAPSLSDLTRENAEAEQKTRRDELLAGPMGSPLRALEAMKVSQSTRPAATPIPDYQARASTTK